MMTTEQFYMFLHEASDALPVDEFWEYIEQMQPSEGCRKAVEASFGITGYDSRLIAVEHGCNCLKCSGLQEFDEACEYHGIPIEDMTLASLDPELLARHWNQPVKLYFHAILIKECQAKATLWNTPDKDGVTPKEKSKEKLIGKIRSSHARHKTW